MRKTAPMSVRLEPALNDRVTAIDAGIQAADAGRLVAHEDVVAWVGLWGRPDELPMPECG